MNLTDVSFFVFVLLTVLFYYLLPNYQKHILLTASLIFYFANSSVEIYKTIGLAVYFFAVTYGGALWIHSGEERKKSRLVIVIVGLLCPLVYLKYAHNIANELVPLILKGDYSGFWFNTLPYIGLSYFVLSAIGYIVDVYWNSYPVESDPIMVALFIFYFPQLVSGPISRYDYMKERFPNRGGKQNL